MKIAIDTRSLSSKTPSGVGHYLQEVLLALTQENHPELILFTTGLKTPKLHNKIKNDKKITHKHIKITNKLINLAITLNIISLETILNQKIDKVWFPNTGFLPKTKARTILTVHDLAWLIMPETYTTTDHLRYRITKARTTIKNADHIIAISNSTKKDIQHLFKRTQNQITTIHHGVSKQFTPTKTKRDKKTLKKYNISGNYILSLATLEPRKNIISLIEAFSNQEQDTLNTKLVLSGKLGWRTKKLKKAIKSSPRKHDIIQTGYIKNNERQILLRNAKCLALPSRYEGSGMQLKEAIACNTPIITSRNSSLGETAKNSALYTRAMSPNELKLALEKLLTEKNLDTYLTNKKQKTKTWNQTAKQTLKILTKK